MSTGVLVLILAVVAALGFGTYRAATDGRFRGTHRVRGADQAEPEPAATEPTLPSVLEDTPWAAELGERATLLQFSSAFCAPCRATRRILHEVAEADDGVRHLEVDAEHHLDLVRRLGIQRTPYSWVFRTFVRPRLGPPAELEDPAPPRFAQGVGLGFALVALVGYLAGATLLGSVAVGFALAAAFLNAVFGLCLGCELYLLGRLLAPARAN